MNIHPLVLLGVVFVSSGVVSNNAGGRAAGRAQVTFYRTQFEADADLRSFEKTNPSCQLWSNWQKMCSRTGDGGRTLCTADANQSVRPSAPFCAGDVNGLNRIHAATLTKEQISRDRFCVSFDRGSTFARKMGRPVCSGQDKQRPFGGHIILSRAHPWCKEWKDKTAFRVANVNSNAFSESGFYCSKPRVPSWCKEADGLGPIPLESPDDPAFGKGRIRILTALDNTVNAPVVGVMCKKKT